MALSKEGIQTLKIGDKIVFSDDSEMSSIADIPTAAPEASITHNSCVWGADWEKQTSTGGLVAYGRKNGIMGAASMGNTGGTDIGTNFSIWKFYNNRSLFNVPASPSELELTLVLSAEYTAGDLDFAYFGFRSGSTYVDFVGLVADASAPSNPGNWQLLTTAGSTDTYSDTGVAIGNGLNKWRITADQTSVKLYRSVWNTTTKEWGTESLVATNTTNIPSETTDLELTHRYSAASTGTVAGTMFFHIHSPSSFKITKPYQFNS